MGLFKDRKKMKDTAPARLERYAQLAKAIGARHLDQAGIEDLARSQGLAPEAWQQAYDGWNARMKVNLALSTQFGRLYQQAGSSGGSGRTSMS
jgi:hypothetical protein